jgi:hypothetical protein
MLCVVLDRTFVPLPSQSVDDLSVPMRGGVYHGIEISEIYPQLDS